MRWPWSAKKFDKGAPVEVPLRTNIMRAGEFNRAFEALYGEVRAVTGRDECPPHLFIAGGRFYVRELLENIEGAAEALANHRRRVNL